MCTIGTAATSIQLLRWMDNNNNKLYQHCVSPFSFSACVVENFAETKDIGNRSVRSIIFHLPCGKCKHKAHSTLANRFCKYDIISYVISYQEIRRKRKRHTKANIE